VVGHETVRAVTIASNLDATPDCVDCAYQPYCGVPPSHSYKTQGTIFGRMRESALCEVYKGIQDYLFEKLADGDAATLACSSAGPPTGRASTSCRPARDRRRPRIRWRRARDRR
jgi:hypothetical protein